MTETNGKRGGFAADPERAREAGRKGAQVMKEKFGIEHFRRIGKRGGTTVRERYGSEYYSRIGKQGSESRWRKAS
ncbi:MAG: KGG domain-containing protein [Armatimonadota bacterium]